MKCTVTVEVVTWVEGGEYWVLEAREVQWRTDRRVWTYTSNRLLLSSQTGYCSHSKPVIALTANRLLLSSQTGYCSHIKPVIDFLKTGHYFHIKVFLLKNYVLTSNILCFKIYQGNIFPPDKFLLQDQTSSCKYMLSLAQCRVNKLLDLSISSGFPCYPFNLKFSFQPENPNSIWLGHTMS